MREQPRRMKMGTKKQWIGIALITIVVLAVVSILYIKVIHSQKYSPPTFEKNAVLGVPNPPENLSYGGVEAEGGFRFLIAGNTYQQEDGSLQIYLTNLEESNIWIRCEICDENKNVLYQSGILKPGQYVEKLEPQMEIANEAMKIEISVYGFEPETYLSRGTIYLGNTLQPW